jgi:hypothetical protein
MVRLSFKLSLFTFTIIVIFSGYAFFFVGGGADNFYRRFTTPPSKSLIVGSSRCAQGIVPGEMEELGQGYTRRVFNYCFTILHSPYGPYYLQSIKKKLRKTKGGVFIIEVNPWTISVREDSNPNEPSTFRESQTFINNMNVVNYIQPNLEYIVKYHKGPYYKDIYFDIINQKGSSILKKSGWLKVNVNMDSSRVRKRKKSKIISYSKKSKKWQKSKTRVKYLKKLIHILETRGEAYVVRMPVSEEMLKVEKKYMPKFDSIIKDITRSTNSKYLNFIKESESYRTTDGNHLWYKDAKVYTRRLSKKIAKYK